MSSKKCYFWAFYVLPDTDGLKSLLSQPTCKKISLQHNRHLWVNYYIKETASDKLMLGASRLYGV